MTQGTRVGGSGFRGADSRLTRLEAYRGKLRQWQGFLKSDPTHYQLLGVRPDAALGAIKSAFDQLAKGWHPDVVGRLGDPQLTREVELLYQAFADAYDVLRHPESRRRYDARLAGDQPGVTGQEEMRIRGAEEQFELGKAKFNGRLYADAEQHFCTADQMYPDKGQYLGWFAWTRFHRITSREMRNIDDEQRHELLGGVEQQLVQAIEKSPGFSLGAYFLARIYVAKKEKENALKWFRLFAQICTRTHDRGCQQPECLDAERYIRVTTMRVDRERDRTTTRVVAVVKRVSGAVRHAVVGKK